MQTIRLFVRLSPILFVFLSFCGQKALETVEAKNDRGQLERWQKRQGSNKKDGIYQRFSEKGTLLEEAFYIADSLQGDRKYYSETGQLEAVEHYDKNQLHGKFNSFYPDGQLKIEQDFVRGSLTGMSIRYYPNGKMLEKVTLKDNVENGPFVEYYDSGNLKTEGQYAPDEDGDGVENGELKEYNEAGVLVRIAACTYGTCITTWKKEK